MTTKQFCTFYLGDRYFGIDVLNVQEVIRYQIMTKVPLAPPVVEGLINLRGQIVTALDMRRRLGLDKRSDGELPTNIIVRTESDGAISLLVDEIGEVIEVSDDDFEAPPDTLTGSARQIVVGTYKLAEKLMLVLDTERAVALE